LVGQEKWQSYVARWGVLAQDVTQAEQFARDWQMRCSLGPCELIAIDLQSDGYKDKLGVVWQGYHVELGSET
jgi:hypothetical protein